MPDSAMAQFLDKLEAKAQRDIDEHKNLLRVGLSATLALIAGMLYYTLAQDAYSYSPLWVVASIFGGGSLGAAIGAWFAKRSEDSLANVRNQVRHELLDGGLLQLVLEHDPYERLPSLRPMLPGFSSKALRSGESVSMQDRLTLLVNNYRACCIEAGLVVDPATAKLATPATRAERAMLFIGLALVIGSGVLVTELKHRFGANLFWLRIPLGGAGFALMSRGSRGATYATPLGTSSVLPSAVRLELAELLRHSDGS